MGKQTKPAWYGVAAVALGSGIFFLAANKGRLFKKATASIKAFVRDAGATSPPLETGPDFTKHGEVPRPQ